MQWNYYKVDMETYLRYWQVISDATALRQFHNFVLKCESVISLQNWNVLEFPESLSMMISKFARHIRVRWNRKVLSLRKRHRREPTLSDLSYFIEEE